MVNSIQLQRLRSQADKARTRAEVLHTHARLARLRAEAIGRKIRTRHERMTPPEAVPRETPWWEVPVPAQRREAD